MLTQLDSILDFENSLIKYVIEDYDNYWTFLKDLKGLIIQLGSQLDKEQYIELKPNVWVSKTASIHPSAFINPPCIIGNNTEIRVNAFIRGSVIIGDNCVVGNSSEIKNSVLFNEAKVPHFNYVGDSILGYKAHLGAGAITSNVKSDNSFITVKLGGNAYETHMRKIGSIVGDNVEVGCNAVLTPGTVIGRNTNIYPLTMVRGEIEKDRIVKSSDNIVQKVKSKKL